ncbi:MgtC/SapB family protein [Nautilia lithotrophica]
MNPDLIHLIITTAFSFLIGLELKTYKEEKNKENSLIGSVRTYTFLGILGFVFYKINLFVYLLGLLSFTILFSLFYYQKLKQNKSSIIVFLLAEIVYSLGPISIEYSIWMPSLIFVLVVFILNSKTHLQSVTKNIETREFETLGKFILLSAVILPLLPKNNLHFIDISPFKIWLAVVIISGISYFSYILQKYFFKNKGYLITGILGGLYSSTATTVVLSKKAKEINSSILNSAIIIATAMMYIRILAIAFIFNTDIAKSMSVFYLGFAAVIIIFAFVFYKEDAASDYVSDQNPLELQTAFLFAFLFVAMMIITKYITLHYGNTGLQVLSFIIGFTDIDPYILSLLTGKYLISKSLLLKAIFIATGSNNILKAIYAIYFGRKNTSLSSIILILFGISTIFAGIYFF